MKGYERGRGAEGGVGEDDDNEEEENEEARRGKGKKRRRSRRRRSRKKRTRKTLVVACMKTGKVGICWLALIGRDNPRQQLNASEDFSSSLRCLHGGESDRQDLPAEENDRPLSRWPSSRTRTKLLGEDADRGRRKSRERRNEEGEGGWVMGGIS